MRGEVKGGIFMKEKSLIKILDRDRFTVEAKQIFPKQIELLVDMVNYGTNLIVRAYDSSGKKLEDGIVIGVLLKQIISMIDTVQELVSKGIISPSKLQIRSAFEASLYIDWILKNESSKKAKYYYVSNLRNTRVWASRLLEGTKDNLAFSAKLGVFAHIIAPQSIPIDQKEEAIKQIANIERILRINSYSSIDAEFEKKSNKKTGVDPKWYTLLGISSIQKMAEDVGRVPEYIFDYSLGSEMMHTASYRDHIKFKKGNIIFEPIRHLNGSSSLLNSAITLCLHSYRVIIQHYRKGEFSNFTLKYKNDWRNAFLNIPTVKEKEIIDILD
jgi:hypothetical protein